MCGRCVTDIRYIIMFCILFWYEYKQKDMGSLVQMHFACLDCVSPALYLLICSLRVGTILEKCAIFNFKPILAKYKSFNFALMNEALDFRWYRSHQFILKFFPLFFLKHYLFFRVLLYKVATLYGAPIISHYCIALNMLL